jgi:hypothetical protein
MSDLSAYNTTPDFYTVQVKVEGDNDWLWVSFEHYAEVMVAHVNFYGLVLSSVDAAERTINHYFSNGEHIEYGKFMRKIQATKIVAVNITATPLEKK